MLGSTGSIGVLNPDLSQTPDSVQTVSAIVCLRELKVVVVHYVAVRQDGNLNVNVNFVELLFMHPLHRVAEDPRVRTHATDLSAAPKHWSGGRC